MILRRTVLNLESQIVGEEFLEFFFFEGACEERDREGKGWGVMILFCFLSHCLGYRNKLGGEGFNNEIKNPDF